MLFLLMHSFASKGWAVVSARVKADNHVCKSLPLQQGYCLFDCIVAADDCAIVEMEGKVRMQCIVSGIICHFGRQLMWLLHSAAAVAGNRQTTCRSWKAGWILPVQMLCSKSFHTLAPNLSPLSHHLQSDQVCCISSLITVDSAIA
jgi:hypothetical protein